MHVSTRGRSACLLLAGAFFAGAIAVGASPERPPVRIAVLPSVFQGVDEDLVQMACQIGGLTPRFQVFSGFDDAAAAFQRGEADAIAGVTMAQGSGLGGLLLPAYRELRLRVLAAAGSQVLRPLDFAAVTVVTFPDGCSTAEARARGWKTLETASLRDALIALRQPGRVGLMDPSSAALISQGCQPIDPGINAPVSVVVPRSSPYARSLEVGLQSLIRTGYAERTCGPENGGAEGRLDWLQKDILILSFLALVGAGLVFAQRQFDPGRQKIASGRSILAPGRC